METILGIELSTWWFLIVGGLFSGYAILDGFDLGAGALHLFFNKEESRRIALNAIGPVWDGNEVWLVIGGGALFAGFPVVYGTLFSAFYIPIILFLVMLIMRAISIEFRSKEPMLWWRKLWDISYCVSSCMISLALGLVLGNVVQGVAIDQNFDYHGNLIDFFNPYAILIAITTLSLFMMHGGIYLTMKTENRLYAKLTVLVKNTTIFFVLMFSITTVATLLYLPHMSQDFKDYPALFVLPIGAILLVANITRLISKRKYFFAFLSSAGVTALLMLMVAVSFYPNIIISNINPDYNITIQKAASSAKSLKIMLLFAAIGFPLVLSYTTFVFWTFRGKVKLDETSY